ncbi:hypothetical protein [Natronococcus occultus]|uniref:Uncharacterized protein n=1 Tax=Natronococcus occultus SP4 TaxID=694430 RepID=L0K1E0_9EURY|nr:hypothetical protein [Natronococcus occultus]AGB38791.1 hypothetical protein Natoc_3046 [Natronococcus occultus SP4]
MRLGDHWKRLLTLGLLVGVLCGLFVWYGTVTYNPALNDYPTEDDIAPTPESYVGDRVTLGGEVVATEPVVAALDTADGPWRVTLADADAAIVRGDEPAVGERISAHGTLTDANTLATDRAYTREPWEWPYMYAISLVGAVWVLGRAVTGWRFDPDQRMVVPREHRLALGTVLASPSVLVSPAGTDATPDGDEPADPDEAATIGGERDG